MPHRTISYLFSIVFLVMGVLGEDSRAASSQGNQIQTVPSNVQLPPPTGRFGVGRTSFDWIDTSRRETFSPNSQNWRELRVDVWYPADAGAGTGLPYIPKEIIENRDGAKDLESNYRNAWSLVLSGSLDSYANSQTKLPRRKEKYPILIFSPGLGLSTFTYSAELVDLASHGYVVIAVEQSYSATTVFPDGHFIPSSDHYYTDFPPESDEDQQQSLRDTNLRALDLQFVLTRTEQLNAQRSSPFYKRLDLGKVGVFGHSVGGRAAIRACQLDKRFSACMNHDGTYYWKPFLPFKTNGTIRQTIMMLDHRDPDPPDAVFIGHHTTREAYNQHRAERQAVGKKMYESVLGGAYRATITTEAVNHGSFSDLRFLQAKTPEQRAHALRALQLVRKYTLSFFDLELKGIAALPLTEKQDADVLIERFGPSS